MAARRLFVARLPWTVCRDTLTQHFQQFGKVLSSKVVFDMKTGRSKRFGFVIFQEPSACESALAENNHVLDGQRIAVQLMTSVPREGQERRIGRSEPEADV